MTKITNQEHVHLSADQEKFISNNINNLNNWLYGFLLVVTGLSLIFYTRVLRGVKFHKQSEDKFKSLVEAAPDALIISGQDGIIQMVNWRAEEVFGYRREEMVGKQIEMLLPHSMQRAHEELREKYMQQHNLRIKEGGRELPGMRKDGSIVMTDITLAPIKTDGETLMLASLRDITGRIEERMQLDSLSRQVNQAKEAIYTMGPDFSITSWNYGAQQLFGYTAKEVIGRIATELVAYDPESGWLESVSKRLAETGGWTGEVFKINKNGSKIPVLTSVTSILSESGILTGFISVSHDISLQKSLEYQLKQSNESLEEKVRVRTDEIRRSEQKYRYLFHHNPIPMWVIEMGTFKFLDVNEMAVQKYGYSRDEFLAMTAEDIRPPNTRNAFRRENNPKTGNLNDGYRGVWQHQKKDGSLIWVEIIAHHIQFEGKQSRLILANDITEKKEAQDLLRLNEKRFRAMIEYNNDMIAMMDAEGNQVYRSPSTLRITGMTNTESGKLDFFKEIVHPDDREKMVQTFEEVLKQPAKPIRTHYRGKHQDGHYIFVEGTLTNLLDEPAVKAIVFNFRDVTLEKMAIDKLIASEKRYRETLDNMLEGIQILDFDWRYSYVNDALVKQARQTREELLGHSLFEVYPDIRGSELHSVFQRCFEERVPQHLENKFVYPDGSTAWFELSFQPVPEGVFVLSMDITDRKLAEERVNNINTELEEKVRIRTRQLQKMNEELESFAYSVSHDLRAPLRGINGFVNILQEDYAAQLDDEAKRITRIIKENSVRMGSLIDDLLTFSRQGRHELEKVRFDTREMILQIISSMEQKTESNRVNYEMLELHSSYGDTTSLRQVWVNLIGNAIKYSRGNPQPAIKIGSYKENGETVYFVKDNGVGFDMKYANKLFKVFQRLHSSDEFEGTGVGLAIVEKIINKHGGRVWAAGEENAGASFFFTLPEIEDN